MRYFTVSEIGGVADFCLDSQKSKNAAQAQRQAQ
jgi:hypothetical protein